ncbi:MAG: VPLPA-CTERM sorting domain-containing protein [Gammaproteobacteria bacterium]|nr:VPLPA-CTERM sorting domain-containing protein [Gammaproteobacteria bacterium]
MTTQAAFTETGAHTWAGTSPYGSYSYDFNLTSSQVAFGLILRYSVTDDIPMLAIFDCVGFNHGDACTGVPGYPIQKYPFPNENTILNGTVSAVPVPAAVYLFGSGLLGLIGVEKRKKA